MTKVTIDRELLPCPFCGDKPELPSGEGTQYEIECSGCGQAMASVQICDLMSAEERAAGSFTNYRYADEFVERAKKQAIENWNTRAAPRQPEGEEIAWSLRTEVAGCGLVRYMTDRKYQAQTQAIKQWYEPFRCQQCVDAQRTIAELREEISHLHTTMMAAAVEIQEHWQSHCDEEGYGPANLMHRLERGIASQYGYTAQTIAQAEAERDTLRQQLAERDAQIASMRAEVTPFIETHWRPVERQRDKLADLLVEVKSDLSAAMNWGDLDRIAVRIDAALAEVEKAR